MLPNVSARPSVPSWSVWPTPWWCTAATMARNWWLYALSSMLLRSSICWLERWVPTHKSLLIRDWTADGSARSLKLVGLFFCWWCRGYWSTLWAWLHHIDALHVVNRWWWGAYLGFTGYNLCDKLLFVARIPSRSWSTPSSTAGPVRIPPVLVVQVPSGGRLWMCPPSGESTRYNFTQRFDLHLFIGLWLFLVYSKCWIYTSPTWCPTGWNNVSFLQFLHLFFLSPLV